MRLFILLSLMSMVVFLAVGCQNDAGPLQSGMVTTVDPLTLGQFQLPLGATLDSAKFFIYVHTANNEPIYIHRVTAAWGETTVTWNNFGGAYDATPVASFVADGTGWRSAVITGLVQDWLDGTYQNFGILLDQQDKNFPRAVFFAREFGSRQAYLQICYTIDAVETCEQTITIADAYIYESTPDVNNGTKDLLYTGWLNETDLEKQSLLLFDVQPSADGCTRTIGYWKNWSGFGPQPDMVTQYLPIWLGNAGADSSIAVTDVGTAVEILSMAWDSPKNGIIKLYAQLLGAKLNIAAGADGSVIADVISDADDFLAQHGYGSWYSLSKTDQKMVIGWMETLDAYNNGELGPIHCDDDDYVD